MSGAPSNPGQIGLDAYDDGKMALFSGTPYSFMTSSGDMAFRLHDSIGVP